MFMLTTLSDLVQISPEDFQKPSGESVQDNINAKYANKVIQNIGLCICLFDILKLQDGIIGYGTGEANVNVEFRVIIFRPFKGEIILGDVANSSEEGIKIRLDFFDDIFVPAHLLLANSHFNAKERVWMWHNDEDVYYYDKGERVRIRVEEEHWTDLSPLAPSERGMATNEEKKSPYRIVASMSQAGLGPVAWW